MNVVIKKHWLIAVILWCVVIFMFSHMPAEVSSKQSSTIGNVLKTIVKNIDPKHSDITEQISEFTIRKSAHFTEYLVLGGLLCCAVRPSYRTFKFVIGASCLCLCLASLYACTDEIHQLFISGRSMRFFDVLIDFCGAIIGILIVNLILTTYCKPNFNLLRKNK